MQFLSNISFDDILCSVLVCIILRQVMVVVLPDSIAGPGGWLINTFEEEA
jgi:hypothetical protein